MFWKILIVGAAALLFWQAKKQKTARTYLRLWGKVQYRRHKAVEADLLRIENEDGAYRLVCDVPSLRKHALVSVSEKEAQRYRVMLGSVPAAEGGEARLRILLEQYKVEGKTFLLTGQEEPADAVYLASAQREKEAQGKCMEARKAGFVLLIAAAIAGLASALFGALLLAAGAAELLLNQPFADEKTWTEACRLINPPVESVPADAAGECPADFAQWSSAEKFLYGFTAKYGDEAGSAVQDAPEETPENTVLYENPAPADEPAGESRAVPESESETDAQEAETEPESVPEQEAAPVFTRGFRTARYAPKNAFKKAE